MQEIFEVLAKDFSEAVERDGGIRNILLCILQGFIESLSLEEKFDFIYSFKNKYQKKVFEVMESIAKNSKDIQDFKEIKRMLAI